MPGITIPFEASISYASSGASRSGPTPAIRSVSLDVCGFSVAHPPIEVRREGYLRLTEHVARGDVHVDLERVPLEQVESAWERQRRATGGVKLVVIP